VPDVALRVTADLVKSILRLAPGMAIRDARAEVFATVDGGSDLMIVFTVDAGQWAPTGAVDMAPAYIRDPGRDPIRLREVCWTDADGNHTISPVEGP
jgi:hypothetical protein